MEHGRAIVAEKSSFESIWKVKQLGEELRRRKNVTKQRWKAEKQAFFFSQSPIDSKHSFKNDSKLDFSATFE